MELNDLSDLEMYASDPNMILVKAINIQTVFGIGADGSIQPPTFHLVFQGKLNDPDNYVDSVTTVSCSVEAAQGLLNTLYKAMRDMVDAALSEEDEGGE